MEELFWGCAGIGLAIVMPALALSRDGPGRDARAAAALGARVLRRARRPQARRAGDLRARGRQRRAQPAHPARAATATTGCIDGHKMWIGNGGIANVHVVNATVDPELGHRGQALFIVPGGTPGLELVRKLDKLGCRASHTAELRFDGRAASRATTCSAATRSSSARLAEGAASGGGRLRDARRVRADAADGRRAGARDRARGARVRDATTRPSARRSAARSSTSRASRSRSPTSPPTSTRRGC